MLILTKNNIRKKSGQKCRLDVGETPRQKKKKKKEPSRFVSFFIKRENQIKILK